MIDRRNVQTDLCRKSADLLLVITGLGTGGAESQVLRIASKLKERGKNVVVASILEPGDVGDRIQAQGIDVVSLGIERSTVSPFSTLSAVFALRRCIRTRKPEVVVSFMYHANILCRLVSRIARVKRLISSIRNSHFGGKRRDLVMRLTEWLDDLVITNSRLAGEQLVARGVVSKRKLQIIGNGISTLEYADVKGQRERIREILCLQDNEFVWIAVGRLEEQKDYRNLLAALSGLVRNQPAAKLLIVGQGPLQDQMEEFAATLHIRDRVEFLGLRNDVPELLGAADAFVLSSAWEGLPNVIMEASASALPIVATRVGGTPELVIDGESGRLVESRNPKQLAEAMSAIMELTPRDRQQMGKQGKQHIQNRYELERIVDEWEACLFRRDTFT